MFCQKNWLTILNMKQAERLQLDSSLFTSKEGNKAQGKGHAVKHHPRDTLHLRYCIQNPCAFLGVCRLELELGGLSFWFFTHHKLWGTHQACREME